jgi:hypothetical protein
VRAGAAELEWGVRQSFVQYVEGLSDGVVAVGNGAARRGAAFLLRGERTATDAAFDGAIRFSGHLGVLDVAMDGIALRGIGGRAAVWTAVGGIPVELAAVGEIHEEADGGLRADAVTLTADGAALLGGVYRAGAPLAPLIIRPVQRVRDDEEGI